LSTKVNLPNNPTTSDNLTGELKDYNALSITWPRTTSGNLVYPLVGSYPSGVTYNTATYAGGIYAGLGQQGMYLVLQDALISSLVLAADFNSKANATTADLTYYVNASTGSDSNSGLSAGTALLTIMAAINKIPSVVNHVVTINVAAGTYAETVVVNGFTGSGTFTISGDTIVSASRSISNFTIARSIVPITITGFNILATSIAGMFVASCVDVTFNYINCISSALTSYGTASSSSNVRIQNSVISNHNQAGIAMGNGTLYLFNCTGTGNICGLYAGAGSHISSNGTEPTGATQRYAEPGGIISNAMIATTTAAPATTGTVNIPLNSCIKTITPTGACSFYSVGGVGVTGQITTFAITTSGTTSYVMTWVDGFVSTGTLSTGTVSGKRFAVTFRCLDGTNWIEIGRTTAM